MSSIYTGEKKERVTLTLNTFMYHWSRAVLPSVVCLNVIVKPW